MNAKTCISILSALLLAAAYQGIHAQEPDDSGEAKKAEATDEEAANYEVSLEVEGGFRYVDQNNDSSKFNEYRDYDTDFFLERLFLDVEDTETGRYFDFRGHQLFRNDQELYLEFGSRFDEASPVMAWSADLDYSETPHLLSNSASSPFEQIEPGIFRVGRHIVDAIQVSNVNNASSWTLPNAGPGLAGEDSRIAAVLADFVRPIPLGTDRRTGTGGYNLYFSERTKVRIQFTMDDKEGSLLTGAGIGDRPPRSLVVQLAEPVDYVTYNMAASFAHVGNKYQVDAAYRYSKFENDVEQMTWDSLFHAPNFFCVDNPACAGATDYDRIRQGSGTEYATVGTMALSPDNTMHSFSVNGSVNLPAQSRLSGSIAFTRMEQDETLLPYATSDFGDVLEALPRTSAEAEIETTLVNLAYSINPVSRLSVRADYRYYDLDNRTRRDEWAYYTQDSSSQSFKNERINIPYGYTQEKYGVQLSYYFGRPGTLGFNFTNEELERPNREVRKTDEDSFELNYRVQATDRMTFMAKYVSAERTGTEYNSEITDQSYSYDPFSDAIIGQADNPIAAFANAPGLRKFDVADRDRDALNFTLAFAPTDGLSINLMYDFQDNEYSGDVPTTITTWESVLREFVTVAIDPTLLGLLSDESRRYALDVSYAPSETFNITGFYSREELESKQRGRYMDENNRINGIGAKDWQNTSGDYLWDATINDETDTVGVAANYTAMEGKLTLSADFSHSRGDVGVDYSAGAQLAEDDTTHFHDWAEWTSPMDAKFETNTLNLGFRRMVSDHITVGLNYMYERYSIRDWQQEATGDYQNRLSDNFIGEFDPEIAGTSQDRVGSRLVTLGNILAPSYRVHVLFATLVYTW